MESTNDDESWRLTLVECGQRFSQAMEQAFVSEIQRAEKFVPQRTPVEARKNRVALLECFLDYLVGTTVAISTSYGSHEEEFQKHFEEVVRDKFECVREIKKERETSSGNTSTDVN